MKKQSEGNRRFLLAASLALLAVPVVLLLGGKRLGGASGGLVLLLLILGAVAVGILTRTGRGLSKRTRARIGLIVVLPVGLSVILSSIERLSVSFDFFALAAIAIFAWVIVQLVLEMRRA